MGSLFQDFKQSLRMLAKSPSFTLAAIAALALGIGVNTAIFSVVNAVILKPLAYTDPGRIVQLQTSTPNGNFATASITKFHTWQQQTSVLQDVAAYDFAGPGFNLTGTVPEQVHGIHVTHDYFQLFGAVPQLGRTFTEQEDLPNGGHVVVISDGLWKRKFGADPHIVGTAISLSGDPYTIVGVLGPRFQTDPVADLWIPFQFDPNSTNQGHFFLAAARLKPGVTLAQANAQLKIAGQQFLRHNPDYNAKNSFAVQPLRDAIVSGVRRSLFVLLGAVGFVLLIACANVANLLLVRAIGRKREFAVRLALGARRVHIIRQLLTESVLLSLTGGVLGLILGYAGVRWLLTLNPGDIPRIGETGAGVGLDGRVLVFTLAVSLATGILFGLFPALGASRPDLHSTLKESGSRTGSGFRQNRVRSVLVISEVSLALVLLVGAALLIRTFVALRTVDPGFNPHNVLTMEMALTGDRFQKTVGIAQLVRLGRERLNAIPGVEAASASCCLPLEGSFDLPVNVVGRKDLNATDVNWVSASPQYFATFRVPILRGRDFTDADTASTPGVVLINQAMAKKLWPKEDPIGQQIIVGKGVGPQFEEPARQVIGIVADMRAGSLDSEPYPTITIPAAQVTDGMTALNANLSPIVWMVRTRTDPRQFISAVTEQLRQASNGSPVARVRTMDEVVIHSTARQDFNMLLLTIFAAAALLLAAIGIYGLMAYSAQQRTQEMGIRMALGADRSKIRGLVVWQGMQLALIGVALGIGAAFALAHLIASFLFGVKWWDPIAFMAVPIVLTLTALLAVWVPAQRASKLDPMEALHTE